MGELRAQDVKADSSKWYRANLTAPEELSTA